MSELVRGFDDAAGKRDRSESGDSVAPAGKRDRKGEPSPSNKNSLKEQYDCDAAMENLESRMRVFLSTELNTLRDIVQTQLDTLSDRVGDLERHVEEKDGIIEDLTQQLTETKEELRGVQARIEESEIISRLPCLILSGAAMAPQRAARRLARGPADAALTDRSADGPGARPEEARGASAAGMARGERGGRRVGTATDEPEDVPALVVATLNRCLGGLNMLESDVDRTHRLPGPNNRVIVRFVRSGLGSIRDQVMWRRLELHGKDLYVNESLTPLRSKIYRSLLGAKKEKKLYTVYTRGGHVYFKTEKFAAGVRVETIDRVRELGFSVVEDGERRENRGGGRRPDDGRGPAPGR